MNKKLLTLLALTLLMVFAYANAGVVSKERADFIVDLFNNVEWPAENRAGADGSIVISVIGDDALVAALKSAVSGKKYTIKKVGIEDDFLSSQMLIISTSKLSSLAKILKKIRNAPILTVTESKGFARYGVMVELITEGDKLEYVVNKMSAKQVHIVISSKLINDAKATFG